jgi:hypothetical protein
VLYPPRGRDHHVGEVGQVFEIDPDDGRSFGRRLPLLDTVHAGHFLFLAPPDGKHELSSLRRHEEGQRAILRRLHQDPELVFLLRQLHRLHLGRADGDLRRGRPLGDSPHVDDDAEGVAELEGVVVLDLPLDVGLYIGGVRRPGDGHLLYAPSGDDRCLHLRSV